MGVLTTQGYRGKLVDKLTGTILDQFSDEDIKVSNNILELFDLGEIPGTYTQTLTLPGTKVNNAFFEQYFDISVWEPDLFNTNQKVEAYLDFDSFYLVNGYLQLNKVNVLQNKFVDSYEVTLFGIISNFSIDTRASFLTDITSLSAYNHTSSMANITASWAGGLFNGDIVYPMIEYGNDATDQPNFYFSQVDFLGIDDNESATVVSDYKPAIRIKKVWDAIFNEFGYTYTGSFWNESWLDNVYMPLNNDKSVPVYNPSIEGYYSWRLANVSASSYFLTAYDSSSATNFRMNSRVYDNDAATTLVGNSFTVTSPITSKYDVKLDLAFEVSGTFTGFSGMPAWYVDYVSGSTVTNTQVLARLNTYMTTVANSRTTTVQEVFNIRDYLFQTPPLNPGTYTIRIYQLPINYLAYTVKLNPNPNAQCAIEFWRCRQAADFKVLDVPSNMPNGTSGIRVIDFIRSIQKKFNLIIYPDKQNPNQFVVETFNNWYKQGQIKDFNRYINLQDKIEYTPANQLGYRKVRYSDAEDTDYVTTLFKRTNNRVYGESNFYDSGSYYSQGTLEVVSDVIGNGPLTLIPGSVYTGSIATSIECSTYQINYGGEGGPGSAAAYYTSCAGSPATQSMGGNVVNAWICARPGTIKLVGSQIGWELQGDCTPTPITGSYGSPMWIPYYIADDKFTPARVLPRLYFYNGLLDSQRWYIEGYLTSTGSVPALQTFQYPYFDNYSTGSLNGTSSIYPQLNARSLLYNNEQAVLGTTPLESLVTEYWATYLELLYNPRTRLVDTTAVIPLADYFNTELNDIAEFRGNYYHLRAINDYNLTTGECNIQMLGPIIPDTISSILSGSWAPTTDPCAFNFSVASYTSTPSQYIVATGGVITTSGSYKIHTFSNDSSYFSVQQVPNYPSNSAEILIVAGGGGGGGSTGGTSNNGGAGGGGAGQLIYSSSYALPLGTYIATVGNGGTGGTGANNGLNGQTSSIFDITSYGGGGGSYRLSNLAAGNGGSGGGGSNGNNEFNIPGAPGIAISGSFGNDGAPGSAPLGGFGGGGGGAASTGSGLTGGAGKFINIIGSGSYYAGGGAGNANFCCSNGGIGGGGNSGVSSNGGNGTSNTGGGGGAAGAGGTFSGGTGGSGIIMIKYKYQA
jgi:hypothetical protein